MFFLCIADARELQIEIDNMLFNYAEIEPAFRSTQAVHNKKQDAGFIFIG